MEEAHWETHLAEPLELREYNQDHGPLLLIISSEMGLCV